VKYFYLFIFLFLISCAKDSFIKDEVIVIENKEIDKQEKIDEIIEKKDSSTEKIFTKENKIDNEELSNNLEIVEPIIKEHEEKKIEKKILFGEVIKIGLLLPLSGDNKKLGKSISNALEMALFETKSTNIQLLFKDSGDTIDQAVEASNQLEQDGASIIIGPIFSFQAAEVRKSVSKNIPIFSFTNDQSIKKEGLWALGFSPKQQIKAIFNEMLQHSITAISLIAPQTIYGDIILQESRKASISKNIKINHIYRYDRNAKDFSEFSKFLTKESSLSDNGLLIIASGKQLKEISSRAQYKGINPKEIKFFGISGWNNHEILGEPALLGGYFVAPQQYSYETFVSRYFQLYDIVPNEISGLGYDILALLSIGLKESKTMQELIGFLTNEAGFTGTFGFFKINNNGDVYRKFVSYEVMERNFVKKRDIMP